jgi:ABC-type multidrug transport system ATPase subunit
MTQNEEPLPTSARKLLVDWANQQDGWVRRLAGEVLLTRQPVTDAVLDETYEAFLIEKGLAEGDAADQPKIVLDETTSAEAAGFTIEALEAVEGVNALAAGQSITFNAGLTILFGENGAGKTGYARVFKQLAAVRTAEPILPNVHDTTAPKDLKARIAYSTGSEPATTLDWRGESGLAPFTRLGVFDSPALHLHVDNDLTYVYTPSDLALFPHVSTAVGAIKDRLDAAVDEKGSGGNPYLGFFTRGTSVYQLIETLGAATDLAEIDALAGKGADSATRLAAARANVEALKSTSIAAQLTTAKSRRDLYAALGSLVRVCEAINATAYNDAVASVDQATRDVETLRRDLFAAAGLTGDGDQVWQSFILAGEQYIEHRDDHDYPTKGDPCVYCRQPLGDTALALVQRYREFANDSAQQRITASRQTMSTLTQDLMRLDPVVLTESIATHRDPESPDSTLEEAQQLIDAVQAAQTAVSAGTALDRSSLRPADGLGGEVEARHAAAATLITDLSGRAEERQEALAKAQKELDELTDRIELAARVDGITGLVTNAKWCQKAAQLAKKVPPVRTSLTGVAKVASEQLINTDFASRFAEECAALRAPDVDLEFPGQKGQAARRKTVPVAKQPSKVLSEGEQKVIGLADFLAEAGLRLSPSPIVFDDPVTSLDYRRIHEVADRIARLAADRQVIVLTHNIWFATEMLSRFEKDKDRCTYYGITDDPAKGVIVPGSHPRWDTVSKTTAKINQLIEAAKGAEGAVQEALIENAYSTIRGWCETVVETELLAGVTQRYQANVMMTKLGQIKGDHLKEAFDVLGPLFEKACRVTEAHSQPLETLSVRPTLGDLETDWAGAQAARKEYINAS